MSRSGSIEKAKGHAVPATYPISLLTISIKNDSS